MKKLVCFYCNKKSNLRYDGRITQWPCSTCEAVNYLDENGDITDPPAATESPAPYKFSYAIPRATSPGLDSSEAIPFCETCLKNQHLYTASLQQYELEVDPTHPEYRESERLYFQYKKTLEKTYPQVCEDCEPRVLERMRAAGKTAKADHLRRLMDKTRARRSVRTATLSYFDIFLLLGKWLWRIGLAGQLLWDFMSLVAIYEANQAHPSPASYASILADTLRPLILVATSETWAYRSLLCSLCACWWNPRFKELNNGFMNHITGFGDWYKLQFLQLLIRSLFYYTAGASPDLYSPVLAGAHTMVPVFILMLSVRSKAALKVDMAPLWNTTPEKLANVGPVTKNPSHDDTSNLGDIGDILDEIAGTPSRQQRPTTASSTSIMDLSLPSLDRQRLISSGTQSLALPKKRGNNFTPARDSPAFGRRPSVPNDVEEMEWTPTLSQTQTTTFNPVRRLEFGQPEAPKAIQPSPFYGRLPEAPIGPAHRLRNPPNQPRLRTSSQETKENFFKTITQRGAINEGTEQNGFGKPQKREMVLEQQKFFPPSAPNEAGNNLADLLTSFSLSTTPKNAHRHGSSPILLSDRSEKTRHLGQATVLLMGILFWHHSAKTEHQPPLIPILVSLGCLLISLRTLLDNIVFVQAGKQTLWHSIGACLGILEFLASVYGVAAVVGGMDMKDLTSNGTYLLGGMLVHEILLTSFGR